jgi:hypothetical protein
MAISRLEKAIGRLATCRACLELAATMIAELPGPVLELGLGNGRTYDHLRQMLPDREIFVFEREIAAHPDCIPDDDHLFLGEIADTLPRAVERFAGQASLLHADVGGFDRAGNAAIAAAIVPFVPRLVRPDGIVVTSVVFDGLEPFDPGPLPAGTDPRTYFMHRPILNGA